MRTVPGYPRGPGPTGRRGSIARPRKEAVLEPWYRLGELVLRPPLQLWFTWRYAGLERVPASGPLIVVGNHLSYLDPFAHGLFVVHAGRRPRFMAKQELFDIPVVGTVLRGAGQIPVSRGTGDQSPLVDAAASLDRGEVVVVYPEGTTATTDPDFSPGRGKTGAVRLSLQTGVPILPVATWGGQYVWRKSGRQSLRFGRPILVEAGEPIEVASRATGEVDGQLLRALTDELMGVLADQVAGLRERYPARWTPR